MLLQICQVANALREQRIHPAKMGMEYNLLFENVIIIKLFPKVI